MIICSQTIYREIRVLYFYKKEKEKKSYENYDEFTSSH